MSDDKKNHSDDDLYEELDEEELFELVEEERQKALAKEQHRKQQAKPRRRFPKWVFWLIAAVMVLNVGALIPQTFSIPAVDFLKTSAKLSTQENIQTYKQSVVVIETEEGRGTGFSISADGKVLTNYHVVEGNDTVTVAFPDKGLLSGHVETVYPSVDLAVVKVDETGLPHLDVAEKTAFEAGSEHVYFIGNPIRFSGIANEGRVLDYIQLSDWDKPVVMMDAPVYRGNSGSPVINEDGNVIGVVFATIHHDDYGRVGLFIPIDYYHAL
ncbi:hypothetical protein GCM10028778_13900 [Barrientosiimonas marina]|uniref:S1C family serine protease n=1 Tax=Lentibacillus kimchii TaxID=1542911 RepID=A0ABW2UR75_9BACI